MRFMLFALLVVAVGATAAAPTRADDGAAAGKIRHLMRGTFDRPEERLHVDPLVVVGNHALAGWIQGDLGGRALLMSKDGKWSIQFCSGDALKSAKTLAELGVPKEAAETLAARLADAEAKMQPNRRAMLSRFDGLVKMDEHGHHPPGHGQHPPKHGSKSH